jgi:hypothetical protein
MTVKFSEHKLASVIGVSLVLIGVTYAAIVLERWDGTSNHIGLWNGPSALTARTLMTPVGETTGPWHYHPGYVYNVVRQGTITIEDGCGSVQSYSAGQAFPITRSVAAHQAESMNVRTTIGQDSTIRRHSQIKGSALLMSITGPESPCLFPQIH